MRSAHPRVEYRVATAEESGLESKSVDLITVAQALHWFDLERFEAEARRVARAARDRRGVGVQAGRGIAPRSMRS